MFNPNEHLMDLKGKAYLQVMWRLVWFREEHPTWGIKTNIVDHDKEKQSAIFHATITDENGTLVSSGFGSETAKDFRDYLEKAETKAVGRALAMLGYGTQFAPEMDEGDRLVDSPVQQMQQLGTAKDAAAYVLTFGEYSGRTLVDVFKENRKYVINLYSDKNTDPETRQKVYTLLNAAKAAIGK